MKKSINKRFCYEIAIYLLAFFLLIAVIICIYNQRDSILDYYQSKLSTDEDVILNPEDFFDGKGTETSPYVISSLNDLELLREVVASGNSCSGLYFGQSADIDMQDVDNWVSISPTSGTVSFSGTYDGRGYTISNLQIEGDGNSLFGTVSGATIENLHLHNIIVSSNNSSILITTAYDTSGFKVVNCLFTYDENYADAYETLEIIPIVNDASYGSFYGCYIMTMSEQVCLFNECLNGNAIIYSYYNSNKIALDWSDASVQFAETYEFVDFYDTNVLTQINENLNNLKSYNVLGNFNALTLDDNDNINFDSKKIQVLNEYNLMAYQKFVRNLCIYLIAMLICCFAAYVLGRKFNVNANKVAIYLILSGSAFVFIGYGVHTRGASIMALLYDVYQDGQLKVFTDFFDLLLPGFDPYTNEITGFTSIYPPLVSLIFACMSLLIPEADLTDAISARNGQVGSLIYAFWLIMEFLLLYELVMKYKKGTKREKVFFFCLLCMTFPLLDTVERGNVSLFCAICIAYYLFNYNNEKYAYRQIAFIALSVAAGFKIYPAVLGLLLIRNRQYKDTLNCLAIGIVINFIPSLFLNKGLASIAYMFINATSYVEGNLFVGGKIDLYHIINIPGQITALKDVFDPSNYYTIIRIVLIFLTVIVVLFAKLSDWKIYTVLILGVIMLGTFSPSYYLVYLFAPLIICVDEKDIRRGQFVYAFLWSGLFMLFATHYKYPFALQAPNQSIWNMTFIEGSIALIFEILLLIEGLASIVKARNIKQQNINRN